MINSDCQTIVCDSGTHEVIDSPCVANTVCVDNGGGYVCECEDGFSGDGLVECLGIYIHGELGDWSFMISYEM